MPPSNWDLLARNHIPGRSWTSLKKAWAVASVGYQPENASDLSEAIDPILSEGFDLRENVSVFEFTGGYVAAFHDAVAALIKSAYVLRSVGNCLLGGQPTWASVDAYHFSFLAGRALLAFLGIHFVQVSDSHCVLDIFPEGETERERAKFARLNSGMESPARLIFRVRSSVIEQRSIWTILVRAVRMTRFESQIEREISKICELSDGFGRSRNDLIYRNSTWIYDEDYLRPSISVAINDDIHSFGDIDDFFVEQRDANFAFAALLARVLSALIQDMEQHGVAGLLTTSYGPCLKQFSGFDVQSLNVLFGTLYQSGAYGIDI